MDRDDVPDLLLCHRWLILGPAGAVEAAAVAFHCIMLRIFLEQLMQSLGCSRRKKTAAEAGDIRYCAGTFAVPAGGDRGLGVYSHALWYMTGCFLSFFFSFFQVRRPQGTCLVHVFSPWGKGKFFLCLDRTGKYKYSHNSD
jgi:hypothetical protein